jgi:hypothetical protein
MNKKGRRGQEGDYFLKYYASECVKKRRTIFYDGDVKWENVARHYVTQYYRLLRRSVMWDKAYDQVSSTHI